MSPEVLQISHSSLLKYKRLLNVQVLAGVIRSISVSVQVINVYVWIHFFQRKIKQPKSELTSS